MTEEQKIAEDQLLWIGIDLDKTVAQNSDYPEFELQEPVEGAWDALNLLNSWGWKIIIYTARPWHDYDKIESWLNKYDMPFRRIVCGKLFVKYMIDDRNVEFHGDWNEVLGKIN